MQFNCVIIMRMNNLSGDIMIKIMFVCHGNICRSPMAEFIFKDMAEKQGIANDFFVSSAATSREEIWNGIGNPVYPPAQRKLAQHGVSCNGKRAVQLKKADYDKYDYFIAMDENNVKNIFRIFGEDRENKVCKLMEFAGSNADVADPWYSGNFDIAYNDLFAGCSALMKLLIKQKGE